MFRLTGRDRAIDVQDQPSTAALLIQSRNVIDDTIAEIGELITAAQTVEARDALLDVRLMLRPAPAAGRVPVIPGRSA